MTKFRLLIAFVLMVWMLPILNIGISNAAAAGRCRIDKDHERRIRVAENGARTYLNRDSIGLWELAQELCISYDLLVAYNYFLIPREPDNWFEIKLPPPEAEIDWLPGQTISVPEHVLLPNGQPFIFQATSPEDFSWPVPDGEAIISQFYKEGHRGLDLALREGVPIRSIGNGRVDRVYQDHHVFGKAVVIDHGNDLYAIYAHLSTILIEGDTLINQGEMLGRVGLTGRTSGPHLHLEMREAFAPVDPCDYFEECKTHIFH